MDVEWTHLAQNGSKRRNLLNMASNCQFHTRRRIRKAEELLMFHESFCSTDVQYFGAIGCGFWGSSFILWARIFFLDFLQCRTHLTFK